MVQSYLPTDVHQATRSRPALAGWIDVLLILVVVAIGDGVSGAMDRPAHTDRRDRSLAASIAYLVSLGFSLAYARLAAAHQAAERFWEVLLPVSWVAFMACLSLP